MCSDKPFNLSTSMERALQRQRRDPYVWARLLNKPERPLSIKLIESPNSDIFDNIMKKHGASMTTTTKGVMEQLKINMDACQWNRRVNCLQKTLSTFPASYGGSTAIGRSYGSDLIFLKSTILNTLYFDTHRCIDFVNSFATILCGAFHHLDIPALREYMTNRDEVFQEFFRYGISSKDVKAAFNAIHGATPRIPSDMGLGSGKDEKVRVLSEHPFMIDLQKEIIMIVNDIKLRYPDFYAGIAEHCLQRGKSESTGGTVIHYFCADIENSMLATTLEALRDGFEDEIAYNIIPKFDGAIVPKTMVFDETSVKDKVQAAIYSSHGLHMRVQFKDMSSDRFDDCGVDIIVNAYQKWKKQFDKEWVKFKCPDKYGRLTPDGTYQLVGYGQSGSGGAFGFINAEENPEFIKQWVADPDKTIYEGLQFCPPPLVGREGYFNTFRGLAAASSIKDMEQSEIDRRIQSWLRHVSILVGHHPEYATYLHKLLAHIIQKPGEKTGVCVFIRSIQGTGKDQFFRFLSWIVGESLCHTVTNMSEIMGSKSANLQNKLLLNISEASFKDQKLYAEELKALITGHRKTYSQKYLVDVVDNNLINVFMFTNNYGGMNISLDDRRYFVVEADGRHANDPEYHRPFNAYILDRDNQIAVYRYYKNLDIEGFVPMNERPITVVQQQMASQTTNILSFFLKENFETWRENTEHARYGNNDYKLLSDNMIRIRSGVFTDQFAAFCESAKIPNVDSSRKVQTFLTTLLQEAAAAWTKYTPEGIVAFEYVKSHGVRYLKFYIPAVQEWLNKVIPDEGGNDVVEVMEEARSGSSYVPGFRP